MGNDNQPQPTLVYEQSPGHCCACACQAFIPTNLDMNVCHTCQHGRLAHKGCMKVCKNCDGHGNRTESCAKKEPCKSCFGNGWIGSVVKLTKRDDGEYDATSRKTCTEKCRGADTVYGYHQVSGRGGRVPGLPQCASCLGMCVRCHDCTSRWAFFDNGFVDCTKCNGTGFKQIHCMYCNNGQIYC